jgi:SAM-dependent methyltransferase
VTAGQAVPELHDSGAYRPGEPRLSRLASPVLRLFDQQRLRRLERLARPGGRLLDAGAGQGRFVARARAAGYEAFGIEPSARGVARAAARGVVLEPVGMEEAEIASASLDAVSLWHVLEHLEDPGAALRRIGAWLRPGGGLLVGVPNLSSWQARIGGERWYHLDVPRHRTHFTAKGVVLLLERSGFEVLRVEHVLLEHNPFGLWQSALNRVTSEPSYIFNLLKRNTGVRARDLGLTLAAVPLIPVALLVELAAGLCRRGGTVAVLARKL